MSKSVPENQNAAPETTAELPSGASSTTLEHQLLKLDVSAYTEKKQGLTYLSWAHAWAQAIQVDADANFKVHLFNDKPYMDVNGTGMVWVTVTMHGKARTCWLPVMDHRNKPIQTPDAFQVNTAIMRCMTKCLALFGLGLNVYAGEDLPLVSDEKVEAKPDPKPQPKEDSQEIADLTLFAQKLVDFAGIAENDKELTSYWKANQHHIDRLKAALPDLYEQTVAAFKNIRTKLKEKNDE